jgi:hypothetical protein
MSIHLATVDLKRLNHSGAPVASARKPSAMAAAVINSLRDLPHNLRKASTNDSPSRATPSNHSTHRASISRRESHADRKQHENEKKAILHWKGDKKTLKPDDIVKRGEEKHVGFSSRRLVKDDFELLKTLGTGE